jgi:hypothetical protein
MEVGLEFGDARVFFDRHIFELTRIEDFSAFLALYKFRVFLTCDNTHARMLADLFHADSLRRKFCRCGLSSAHTPGISVRFWEIVA